MTTENGRANDQISISDLARRCFSAYELKDRQMIEDLLSDDFTFTSPLDDRIDRQAYFKRCWPNSEIIRTFQIEKLFESGDEAFVRYECETKAGKKFRNTEWFRFEGDKLKEVQVYFGEETQSANQEETGETVISAIINERVQAVRDKNVNALLSNHAPNILSFDVINPLHRIGVDMIRERVERWLSSFQSSIGYEVRDLSIKSSDELAFCHYLYRVSGTLIEGGNVEMWVRATICFEKIDDKWTIIHEHQSVPFDPETGKASLNLKP
ncbi:ketosteroid isomerase [Pseudanabaena sp. lw0831]|uniref:nuclear transport factor 2 family protein n=1 Tax=Pseudanabaena sp. lw0831 TaxID=1357935 RepID=UPI0019166CEF|nr:nuclear transport factor 2 family protein [Pseudanabaena sp. lw0831]GBO54189.1 ketosteroid isomerase [Pseudanabaena sp. lw0831]